MRFYSDILLVAVFMVTDPCGDCVVIAQNEGKCKYLRRPLGLLAQTSLCFAEDVGLDFCPSVISPGCRRCECTSWIYPWPWTAKKKRKNRCAHNWQLSNPLSYLQLQSSVVQKTNQPDKNKTKKEKHFYFFILRIFCFGICILGKVNCLWHID